MEHINIECFSVLCINEINIVEDIDEVADVMLETYMAKYNKPIFPNLGSLWPNMKTYIAV